MVISIYLGNNDDGKIGTAKPEFWHHQIQDDLLGIISARNVDKLPFARSCTGRKCSTGGSDHHCPKAGTITAGNGHFGHCLYQ